MPASKRRLHPDTRGLAAGEVLVLEHDSHMEYIFPATPEADAPFLMRSFDGGEPVDGPTELSLIDVIFRSDGQHNPRPLTEIDIEPPELAATGEVDG